jgi:hypothetical protein
MPVITTPFVASDTQRNAFQAPTKHIRDAAVAFRDGVKHTTTLKKLGGQHALVAQHSDKAEALIVAAQEPLPKAELDAARMIVACEGVKDASARLGDVAALAAQTVRDLRL